MSWLKVFGQFATVVAILYVAYLGLYFFVFPKPIQAPEARTPLITLVNEARAEKGVAPLISDQLFNETAELKAQDMVAKNYYGHDPNDGTEFGDIIFKHRPESTRVAENLAQCYKTNEETVEAWKKSPEHYATMIDPEFTRYGTAMVWEADHSCYITVNHFGVK